MRTEKRGETFCRTEMQRYFPSQLLWYKIDLPCTDISTFKETFGRTEFSVLLVFPRYHYQTQIVNQDKCSVKATLLSIFLLSKLWVNYRHGGKSRALIIDINIMYNSSQHGLYLSLSPPPIFLTTILYLSCYARSKTHFIQY